MISQEKLAALVIVAKLLNIKDYQENLREEPSESLLEKAAKAADRDYLTMINDELGGSDSENLMDPNQIVNQQKSIYPLQYEYDTKPADDPYARSEGSDMVTPFSAGQYTNTFTDNLSTSTSYNMRTMSAPTGGPWKGNTSTQPHTSASDNTQPWKSGIANVAF